MLITASDILALLPASGVTADDVTGAHLVIETYVDVDLFDTDIQNFSASDLRCLKRAITFQACFMASNPNLFQTAGIESQQQNNITISSSYASDYVLAPLAERVIKNLSWKKGSRRNGPAGRRQADFFTDEYDPNWKPFHI